MADITSALLQLVLQDTGNNNNGWGVILNTALQRIEDSVTGVSAIALTGGTKTLTDDEARPAIMQITGTLTSNAIIQVPARYKRWVVFSTTTGNFNVSVKTAGGAAYIIPNGVSEELWCDGTNIRRVGDGGQVPVGAMIDWPCGATPPAGFVIADGTAINRVLYGKLFALYGTAWGTGDGSTTFNLPDTRNRYSRGPGGTSVATYISCAIQSHTHTVTDPTHNHGHNDPAHTHVIVDGGHSHSLNDPGHAHAVSDPSHQHLAPFSSSNTGQTFTSAGGGAIAGFAAQFTNTALTGVLLFNAFTGQSVVSAGTGITAAAAQTGMTNAANSTGISIVAAGGAETMPNSYTSFKIVRYQ